MEWLETSGFALSPTMGPVIVNAHCNFLRQLKYPGEIEIRTYLGMPGRSSFETVYEIRRVDEPDVLCAEGSAKVVWVDFTQGKSAPLPEELRQLIADVAE